MIPVPINVMYRKPVGPNDKVEFFNGAMFGVDRKLSERSWGLFRSGFGIGRVRTGPDGTKIHPVMMPYMRSYVECYWHRQRPGEPDPRREDLINIAIVAVLSQNGAVEIIFADPAVPAAAPAVVAEQE